MDGLGDLELECEVEVGGGDGSGGCEGNLLVECGQVDAASHHVDWSCDGRSGWVAMAARDAISEALMELSRWAGPRSLLGRAEPGRTQIQDN